VVDDGYRDGAVENLNGHKPAGPFRGGKYSLFEAGTRVPFVVRWLNRVKPGVSDALLSQVDLLSSFAALTGQQLAEADAPDSLNMLPALLGESKEGRDHLVSHSGTLALIQGDWKYIEPSKGPKFMPLTQTETGRSPTPQLYRLDSDPGETADVAAQNPDKVREMAELLVRVKSTGRSR
jgi:arylsulfatase A-like enzyme